MGTPQTGEMGLDVYVGSLTRYLCGNWETVVQTFGRDTGQAVEVVRQHDPPDAITDPSQVLSIVLSWREGLSESGVKAGLSRLEWDERADAPYFTNKPAWDGYGDLVLWAAYEQVGRKAPHVSVDNWFEDATLLAVKARSTDYPTLIQGVEVWFPVDFRFTFDAPWVTGDTMKFGSAQQLVRELRLLNSRAWKGSDEDMATWRRVGKERDQPLEVGARFACALFLALAAEAVAHRLVMKLDY